MPLTLKHRWEHANGSSFRVSIGEHPEDVLRPS